MIRRDGPAQVRGFCWLACASMLAMAAQPVHAQTEAQPQAGEDQAQIGDIIVTARRREESQQTVPIAVATFDAQQLTERSVTDLADLSGVAPNLYVLAGPSGGQSTADFYIRGIGQIDYLPTAEPGVGLYVDGVYLSGITGSVLDLADIERVEVLRGPQGTLFGRNSIGGAINITSRMPGEEFGGEVELGVGNRDRYEGKARFDIPLDGERAAMSIAGIRRVQDGFGRRLGTGEEMGDTDLLAGRATLRFTPTSRFNLLLSVDGTTRDERAAVQSPIGIVEQDPTYPVLLAFGYATPSPTCPGTNCTSPFLNKGPYESFAIGPNVSDLDVWGVAANAEWDVGGVTLKSITAYREQESLTGYDADGSPVLIFEQIVDIQSEQFSQELQLLGTSGGLDWLVGGYYFDGRAVTDYRVRGLGGGLIGNIANTLDSTSLAAFGSLTFAITDRLKLTGGLRYSWDEKNIADREDLIRGGIPTSAYRNPAGGLQPIGYVARATESWDEISPKGSLEFQASDNAFLYASIARGYKSGSFNVRPNSNITEPLSFEPETVTTYELGGKFDLLDRRLRVNVAGFRTDYADIQQLIVVPDAFLGVASPTVNAGEARLQGVELEVVARPTPELTLNANIGYLDSKFTKLSPPSNFPGAMVPFGLNAKIPGSPEWTAAGGAQYEIPVAGVGRFTLRGDVNHRSRTFFTLPNLPGAEQEPLTLVNLRVSFETEDESWRLSVWGTNVTDEVYVNYAISQFGILNATFGAPAEYGVSLLKRF